jgi:two-component system, chemotaxis family, chemotaxis protein CheY
MVTIFKPSNEMRILVVDDMMAMRARVINQLKSFGVTDIEQAGNGEKAFEVLEQMRQNQKPINLVICDWNMPVMTGIDLLEKIRKDKFYSELLFIMVTAEGEKQQVIKALKSGVSDYIIKPFEQSVLEQKLAAVWSRKLIR